ncbi:nacht and ankyrin domain containing protein [Grosmannia clavigera kw1407]|uniref:Nacht and ankyrin domain containing protein n=1 Tax=Grosmannia clavigera (strain kw1407 / UAMH 11150) TaxID=655863 RepID=F0XDZ5_GROCL|nr:nacht and ankyrin domain containing protein [Grosmannia clavigera kw1407]EFX03862.1 nacht and ankyrin domain containing protein [Grosmannia clavigera kw1407]
MSFGWSVGDLIAAIDVVCKVANALSETNGSAVEFQETIQWLSSVGKVLKRLQAAPKAAPETDIKTILAAVLAFQNELIKEYGDTLGPMRHSGVMQGAKRKYDMVRYRMTVKDKVKVLRKKVQASLDVLDMNLGIDIHATVKDTNEVTRSMQNVLKSDKEKKEKEDREIALAKVSKWLNPVVATRDRFDERSETNVVGSGQWLLHTEAYQKWISSLSANGQETNEQNEYDAARRLLWITGIPGSGKTSLATSLVQEFGKATRGKMFKTAYFYCETREQKTTTLRAILRTWTWQLMQQCTWDAEGLAELTKARMSEPDPGLFTLKKILVDLIRREKDVVLVLDGLDECAENDRKKFITGVLPILLQNAPCAIFSRLSNNLVQLVDGALPKTYQQLHISPADTAGDMRKFSAQEIGTLKKTSAEMQKELMHAFERRANGMFLWVELMVRTLQDCLLEDYVSEIEEAPVQLNDVYRSILGDIWSRSQSVRRHSKFILRLLTCAARPLSLKEISTALQVTVDEPTFRYGKSNDGSILSVPELLGFCGSMVTVTSNTTDPIVSLVHESAREYLADPDNRGQIFGDLIVDEQETHGLMARICLTYLCYNNVPAFPYEADLLPGEPRQTDRAPLQRTADAYLDRIMLQRYATTQWAWHVLASESPLSHDTTASLLRLCRSEESTIRWAQTALFVLIDRASITGRGTQDDSKLLAPICERIFDEPARREYADWLSHLTGNRAERTFSRWTRLMMPGDGDIFPSDVHVAAHFDFLDYLRNYLEAGGDPNRKTVTGNTPLHACAHCETVASAELLLKHKADPNVQGFAGIDAMAWGMGITPPNDIHTGHFSVAEVLLKAGADPFSGPFDEHSTFCRAMVMALTDLPPYSDGRRRLVADDPWVLDLFTKMMETNTVQRQARLQQVVDRKWMLSEVIRKGALPLAHFLIFHGANISLIDPEDKAVLDVGQVARVDGAGTLPGSLEGKLVSKIRTYANSMDDSDNSLDNDRKYWPETADDVFRAYLVLQSMLRASRQSSSQPRVAIHTIIVHILNTAGYWLKLTASREEPQSYNQDRSQIDPVYLTTPPLLGRKLRPLRSVIHMVFV